MEFEDEQPDKSKDVTEHERQDTQMSKAGKQATSLSSII
jgi:hypothetical protein